MSPASSITPEQLRAEALLRALKALELIEAAQNNLAGACAQLSSLEGGIAVWKATSKLHDRVHAHWYRVQHFRQTGRFRLDSTNVQALAAREKQG